MSNWVVWLLFLAEVVTMLAVVPRRRAWLRGHLLDVAIVVLTPPVLPASMQAARLFRLFRLLRLARAFVAMRRLFTPEGVRYAAITTGFLVLTAGGAFAAIEKKSPRSPALRLGWHLLGDLHRHDRRLRRHLPATDAGRVIAAAVMLTGIGFVAVVTGAVAERFLSASRQAQREERHLADEVAELRARLEQLES